jgi:predicted kinase
MKVVTRRHLLVMCGLPASGKSTLCNVIRTLTTTTVPLVLVSSDVYIELEAHNAGKTYDEMWIACKDDAEKYMHATKDQAYSERAHVLWDQTNLGRNKRIKILRGAPKDYHRTCIYFEIPEHIRQDRLKQRTEKVIPSDIEQEMIKQYQKPEKDEGWDNIFRGQDVLLYCQHRAKARQVEEIFANMGAVFNVDV